MKHKGVFETGGEFRILPRTVFIPNWQLHSRNSRLAGPETAVSMSRRETTQINGVRDYIYGDRISRIHWNATAKTGAWKSKEFEHESLPKTILVLDAHTLSYTQPSQFELAVSTAASLLEYGSRERISMGLCTLGKTVRAFAPAEGYLERQQMLHHLVDIHADGYGGYKEKLEGKRQYFPSGAFFILISPLTDDKMLGIMRWAKSRHMTPYQIHTGIPGQTVYRQGSLKTVLQERGMKGVTVSSLSDLPAALGVADYETITQSDPFSWYRLFSVLWLLVIAMQWIDYTEPLWFDETTALVTVTLLSVAAIELLPLRATWRWIIKAIVVMAGWRIVLIAYDVFLPSGRLVPDQLYGMAQQFTPYIWFSLAAWVFLSWHWNC